MLVLRDTKNPLTRNGVCGIGSFDGVHRGHQAIVARLKEIAGNKRGTGIITFAPLPFFVLKNAPICCLTPAEEKNELFNKIGVDFIYYFEFTREFAQLSPRDFVHLIARQIEPSTIVVGENFHFGNMREGNARFMESLARDIFRVEILPKVKDEGTISSTRIRELLLLGNIRAANRLLGREYSISGNVIKGKGRGKNLGFPTVNFLPPEHKLIPLDGVYKVIVIADGTEHLGAMFCRHDLLEVHIIGFSGALYGKRITAKFLERIRGIEHFDDDTSLKSAIAKDIQAITEGSAS
jgi:riboflavin kinase/FMN adenylyltransferase